MDSSKLRNLDYDWDSDIEVRQITGKKMNVWPRFLLVETHDGHNAATDMSPNIAKTWFEGISSQSKENVSKD